MANITTEYVQSHLGGHACKLKYLCSHGPRAKSCTHCTLHCRHTRAPGHEDASCRLWDRLRRPSLRFGVHLSRWASLQFKHETCPAIPLCPCPLQHVCESYVYVSMKHSTSLFADNPFRSFHNQRRYNMKTHLRGSWAAVLANHQQQPLRCGAWKRKSGRFQTECT